MSKRYEILDSDGTLVNTVVADLDFLESVYPGHTFTKVGDGTETPRPIMIINSITADADHASSTIMHSLSEVTCPVGAVLTVSAELRDADGNVLPISDSFRMPLRARDGREKVLLAMMVGGLVSITVPLRESGVWSASQATINEALPPDFQMDFAGIDVFVVEA